MRRIALLVLAICAVAEAEDDFRTLIEPRLERDCRGCHGATQQMAKLDLRTRESILKGGQRGPALVPGKAEESLLYRVVAGLGPAQMPPGDATKVWPAELTGALRKWIDEGAAWPAATPAGAKWTYKAEDLWAFQPVKAPRSATIDELIQRPLKAKGFSAAPRADRRTLIRRVTYDLTGLPPTPEEVEAFVRDERADAWVRLVERLLASPRYGERWGRHWLDVVRYADTDGYSNDYERPNAWRYRDYVIRSFNADKPYDRFVLEQIAGDELDPKNPEALIATGFLRMGPWEQTAMSVAAITRQLWLDDVTHNTANTFLGVTLGCARCHDHKFDPIPTKDYYSFQAAFATTQFAERPAAFLVSENQAGFERDRGRIRQLLDWNQTRIVKNPGPDAGEQERERIYRKRTEIYKRMMDRFEPKAFSVDTGADAETHILVAGNLRSPGERVGPAGLSLTGSAIQLPATAGGRRLELAKWIASKENPLTARVMVNRIWQGHFGKGIAGNANNFGKMGKKPTHPELLDFLASEFVRNGWSVKAMHRLILRSETYQQDWRHPEHRKLAEADPENAWLAYFPARRLTAEEMRDSALQIAGELSLEGGGPGTMAEINEDVAMQPRLIMGTLSPVWQASATKAERNRRSVYLYQKRGIPDPMLEVFNQPGMSDSCERRDATTVPTQVFTWLNGKFSRDAALALAKNAGSVPGLIRLAYQREGTKAEIEMLEQHYAKMLEHHRGVEPAERGGRRVLVRSLVGELTGKRFDYQEEATSERYEENLHPRDVSVEIRALAEIALVLLNANEFVYVY